MLWFLALAGISAAAVAAYNQLRRRDPHAADAFVEILRQVTTVLVVLSQAVIGALDALGRPRRSFAVSEPGGYGWADFDD